MQPDQPINEALLGEWRIEMIKERPVMDNSPASLRFDAGGRLSGNTSCNRMSSSYSLEGSTLSLQPGAVTKMMCQEALMEQEARYLSALAEVQTARIDQGMLYLEGEGGQLIFKAAPVSSD